MCIGRIDDMFQCGDVPVRRRWKCVPMSGGRAHSPWSETELCVKVVNSHVLGGLVVCVAQLLLSGEA